MRRLVWVLLGFALIATACEAEPGSVTFTNNSDSHLLWIGAVPEHFEPFLTSNVGWFTTAPGQTRVHNSSGGSWAPDWCDNDDFVHYLMRPIDGQPMLQGNRTPVTLDDFEIVFESRPGICWGKKHASWSYSG